MPNSSNHFILISLNASLGTTIAGYFFTEMDMLTDYPFIQEYIHLISTTQFIIIILSILLSCYIAENYGRKKSFYLGDLAAILGSLCCGLGWNYNKFALFVVGRVLSACSIGVFFLAVPLYSKRYVVKEYTPTESRLNLAALTQIMLVLGKFIALFISTIFYNLEMNYITFFFPIIPAGFQMLMFRFVYTEETPLHLWLSGKRAQVNHIQAIQLISIHYNESDEQRQSEIILSEQERHSKKITFKEIFTAPLFRRALFIACGEVYLGLGLFRTFLGPDAMLFIIETKLVDLHLEWLILIGFYFANLMACLSCFFFFERIGRVPLLKLGALAMFLLYVVLTIYAQVQMDFGYLMIAGVLIAIYELSLGTVFWIFVSDTLGAKSLALAVSCSFIGTVIELELLVLCMNANFEAEVISITTSIFAALTVTVRSIQYYFFINKFIVETKGLTRELIQRKIYELDSP